MRAELRAAGVALCASGVAGNGSGIGIGSGNGSGTGVIKRQVSGELLQKRGSLAE